MEILPKSKLLAVLEAYPALEEQIVHIAPAFKNLKNPVLRRTVGSLATLEQVAKMGGMNPFRLVNTLRRNVGQPELPEENGQAPAVAISRSTEDPQWIAGEPQFTLDGTAMLERGEVPVAKVNELLGALESGRYLLLVTHFEPTPILDSLQKQNRKVFSKKDAQNPNLFLTFIG